jgi:hypothetical protein
MLDLQSFHFAMELDLPVKDLSYKQRERHLGNTLAPA